MAKPSRRATYTGRSTYGRRTERLDVYLATSELAELDHLVNELRGATTKGVPPSRSLAVRWALSSLAANLKSGLVKPQDLIWPHKEKLILMGAGKGPSRRQPQEARV